MKNWEAILIVLFESEYPLTAFQIAQQVRQRGWNNLKGKTPENTVSRDLKKHCLNFIECCDDKRGNEKLYREAGIPEEIVCRIKNDYRDLFPQEELHINLGKPSQNPITSETEVIASRNSSGITRQADPMRRQQVEQVAVAIVSEYFEKQDYQVDSVESDNVGWDLEAVCDQILLRLEVKGLSGLEVNLQLTPNEYAKMQEFRDSYRICVVTNALCNPRLDIFTFSPASNQWVDLTGTTLMIEKVVAARCRSAGA